MNTMLQHDPYQGSDKSHVLGEAISQRKEYIQSLRTSGVSKERPEFYRQALLTFASLLLSEMSHINYSNKEALPSLSIEELEKSVNFLEDMYNHYKFIRSEVVRTIY